MRTEAPTFKRCCVCIPLRYGLISWGYLRLLISSVIFFELSYNFTLIVFHRSFSYRTFESVVLCLSMIVVITDIVMGFIFVYGCHKKKAMLIKKYYYHNIFLLTLFIALFLYYLVCNLHATIKYGREEMGLDRTMFFIIDVLSVATYIFVQLYVTLLVKSQFVKLENGDTFRFHNNATEAECSMNISSSRRETTADCDRKDANDSNERQFV